MEKITILSLKNYNSKYPNFLMWPELPSIVDQ